MANLLVTQGTQSTIKTDTVGGVEYPVVKIDVGAAGATSLFTSTLGTVQNLNAGTITSLVKGTISAGTINNGTVNTGTVDDVSQAPPNYWGTSITTGTSLLGTIKPAIAGSAIFVTDLIISAGTQTTLVIGKGGTSTPLMGTLNFATNGGLAMPFRVAGSVTSGSALVYKQSADNTLTIYAQGYVR